MELCYGWERFPMQGWNTAEQEVQGGEHGNGAERTYPALKGVAAHLWIMKKPPFLTEREAFFYSPPMHKTCA